MQQEQIEAALNDWKQSGVSQQLLSHCKNQFDLAINMITSGALGSKSAEDMMKAYMFNLGVIHITKLILTDGYLRGLENEVKSV